MDDNTIYAMVMQFSDMEHEAPDVVDESRAGAVGYLAHHGAEKVATEDGLTHLITSCRKASVAMERLRVMEVTRKYAEMYAGNEDAVNILAQLATDVIMGVEPEDILLIDRLS